MLAGTIAVAVIAAGAWAAGTAIHGSGPSVRFTPASSTAAGSTGSSGGTPPTPHPRRNLGGGGVVSGVDTGGRHDHRDAPRPPVGDHDAGRGTGRARDHVGDDQGHERDRVLRDQAGATATDITTGMRLAATGTANADATLTATNGHAALLRAGPERSQASGSRGPERWRAAVPKGPANPPFAFGTVTSVTTSGGDTTLVVTGPRGARTVIVTPTTTITETIKGGLGDVGVGDMVLARGHRNSDGSVDAAVVVDVAAGLKGVGRFGLGFGFGRGLRAGAVLPGGRGGPAGPFGRPAPAGANARRRAPCSHPRPVLAAAGGGERSGSPTPSLHGVQRRRPQALGATRPARRRRGRPSRAGGGGAT